MAKNSISGLNANNFAGSSRVAHTDEPWPSGGHGLPNIPTNLRSKKYSSLPQVDLGVEDRVFAKHSELSLHDSLVDVVRQRAQKKVIVTVT